MLGRARARTAFAVLRSSAVSEILAGVWSKRALLGEAAGYTVLEALVGYGLGCPIGIGLAVAITMLPPLRAVILPAATAINSVPVVASRR